MWCYTTSLHIMMKKMFSTLILFGYEKPTIQEKAIYLLKLLMSFGPVVYLMEVLNVWFIDNEQFFSFLILSLLANVIVGAWYHKKAKTFRWDEFFKKNIQMWLIILIVYPLLQALSLTAGDNWVGQGFETAIQLSTLLYPTSKVFKNVYIVSKRKFPPAFIMERVYNFEKTGDLSNFTFKGNETKQTFEPGSTSQDEDPII